MAEQHVRAIQYYSSIEDDEVRHVMEVIALDIGRDDSPAHTSFRKIAKRIRRSVNKTRDLVDAAVASGELIQRRDGKYMVYSINHELVPYGRTSEQVNSGKFGQQLAPATVDDLERLEERVTKRLTQQQERLYQTLYQEIVSIVSRALIDGDTEVKRKNSSKGQDDENHELARFFESHTGCMANPGNYEDEWVPILDSWRKRYGVEGAKDAITRATAFARGENRQNKTYIITSPASLVNIVANLPAGGQKDGVLKVGAR